MRKKTFGMVAATVAMGLFSGIAMASPSFLSTSGNILTPNDAVLSTGDFTADFHDLALTDSVNVIGVNIGVAPNLELGLARYDSDAPGVDTETLVNAKYRLLPETATRPSVTLGAVDATGQIDTKDDPGLYVVLGKNLTRVATDISGEPVQPIRGYIGGGTGIYSGVFLAADWAFTPRATVIVEYLSKLRMKGAINENSVFNAGVRFDVTDALKADVALVNAEDFGFGISYSKKFQ